MKTKTSSELIVPRQVRRRSWRIVFDKEEDAEELAFRAKFSRASFEAFEMEIYDLLDERGWKQDSDGDFWKEGVQIDSIEAYEKDRLAASAYENYEYSLSLVTYVERASLGQLRMLHTAFCAGSTMAESLAYSKRALGRGRKRKKEDIFRALDRADAALRTTLGKKQASAAQLASKYTGPNTGGHANFATWVSRWRASKRALDSA